MCGKEIERNTRGHRFFYCTECMKKRKAEKERAYYQHNKEHYQEYAKKYRKAHKNNTISPERAEYLRRSSWKASKIRKQLPQFCIICGTTSHLQAHRKEKNGDYTIENVVLLCPSCHKRVHSGVETID